MVTFSLIQLLNLPAIIILGILTSIDDIKHSKIRNKYVLFSIIYSLVTLFVTILFIYIRGEKISIGYISLFFSNLLLALVFGFIVWISGLWSAGDAKLFLSFSALIPLTIYKWGTIGIFPSYIILINTFTPLFIYYFVKLFFKIKFKILISEIRMAINPKQLFNLLIFFLGFSWIIQIIIKFIGLDSNYIIRLAALIFIFFTLKKVLKKWLSFFGFFVLGIRLILFPLTFDILRDIFFYFSSFIGLRVLMGLGFYAFSDKIYIESLESGMSLAEDIVKKDGKYVRVRDIVYYPMHVFFKENNFESVFSNFRRLNKKDVKIINKLHTSGKYPTHDVFVRSEIPFAIFLFLGVLLTLIFRGNFLVSIFSVSFL